MAFAAAITEQTVFGNKVVKYGTYTSTGGDTGGDITTYLSQVDFFDLQPGGASVIANNPVVNETLPLRNSTGSVTIVTTANETGYWFAIGTGI